MGLFDVIGMAFGFAAMAPHQHHAQQQADNARAVAAFERNAMAIAEARVGEVLGYDWKQRADAQAAVVKARAERMATRRAERRAARRSIGRKGKG